MLLQPNSVKQVLLLSLQVLNEQFNQLVIVNREFYRLRIYNYFQGDGLTYNTSNNVNFNVINTLTEYSNQTIGQNENIIATAVQNNLGDTNVQSQRFALLVNNTNNQYIVEYGTPSTTSPNGIFYNTKSQPIASPSTTGSFWCSSVQFIFKTNVVVSCVVANGESTTQYFYFLDYTNPANGAIQTQGATFQQSVTQQSFSTKLQAQASATLSANGISYFIGVINTNFNGVAYFSQFLEYSISSVPVASTVLKNTSSHVTVSNQIAYVDFYISSVGIVFLLQNTGGLYIYNSKGQQTAIYNPESSYLALAVYEIQILQTNPVYQIAIGSLSGIVQVSYNPYQSQNFIVSQYIPTSAFINQNAQLYLSPQFIAVVNGNLSVFPGPDNEINSNDLLATISLNGTFSAFNILANMIVVGNQSKQYVYIISNPQIYTTTINTNGLLTVTATDVSNQSCSLTFNYQSIASTSTQVYPTTSTTNIPNLDVFYPLTKTLNLNQMFIGPALVYSYQGTNIQVNSVPIIQYGDTITYIENFYDPAGFEEEAILQVTIDSSNNISFYQTNVQQQTKKLLYTTPLYAGLAGTIITQIDVGFNGVNYIYGILNSNQNLYLFQFGTTNPIQQTATSNIESFNIISNYIYLITKADMIVYLSSNFQTSIYTYSVAASTFTPQLFSNQLAYGELLFLTTGQSVVIFKTALGQMEILNTITIANNYIIVEIGLTNWGIYMLTAQSALNINLVFYPRDVIFSKGIYTQITANPITLPTFGYTLSVLTGATYNYCYVTATNQAGQNFLLTYQNSPTLYGTLYFVYPISSVQFLVTDPISAVGWKQYDAIVFTVSSTSPVNLQLFAQANQVIASTATTSVQVNQTIQIGATSQVNTNQATSSLVVQTYNFVQFNEAVYPQLSPSYISMTGLFSVDPRSLFYGNTLQYNVSNSSQSTYTTNYQNPLIVYPQQQVTTSQHFTGSTQIVYNQRITTLILQNNTVIFSPQDYSKPIFANQSINYNVSSTCGFIFTEFYTGFPITICQNSSTIPTLTFFMYNITGKNQKIYNYSITTGYTFFNAQYLGGVLVIVLTNGSNYQIIPGLFYASSVVNSTQSQYMLFSPTQNNADQTVGFTVSITTTIQYTALNITLQRNIQNSSVYCAKDTQYCLISYGIATLTSTGTLTLYTYTTQLGTETQAFYLNPIVYPIPSTPLNPTQLPNTYTPNLQNILGGNYYISIKLDNYIANSVFYGIAQSNNNTYYGTIPSIPIVITSQYGSYIIDLFISQNVYYQANLECLLMGYELASPVESATMQSPIYGSTVATQGLVAVTYVVNSTQNLYIVMSYGNVTDQCAEYGYATIIQGYEFTMSGNFYQNLLVGAEFPQLVLPIPNTPVIQFTNSVYISFTPNAVAKNPISTLQDQLLQTTLYAYPLNNSTLDLSTAASTKLTFNYTKQNYSQGTSYTRQVDYDNAYWIVALVIFLLGVIGFLCYKSNSKQYQQEQQSNYIEV